VALLAAEAGVRVYFAVRPRHVLADELARLGPFPRGGNGRWLQALQVVPDERICYRLAADVDGFFDMGGRRVRFQTNSAGFRGPEWSREKPPGTVRIVGIGDSVMMGWGVEESECYLSRLIAELNRDHDRDRAGADGGGGGGAEVRYEGINLAVGGYNTVQEVATLRTVGLAFQPDIVILGLVTNDASGIIYRGAPASPLTLSRSFLRDALVLHEGAGWPPAHGGWEEFRAALEELAAMQRAQGFRVVAVSDLSTDQTGRMLGLASQLGFETVDLAPVLKQRVRERGLKPSALQLEKDPHPSPLAHELIAAELVGVIDRSPR
jgi:lysophospholipase L1-like esterase